MLPDRISLFCAYSLSSELLLCHNVLYMSIMKSCVFVFLIALLASPCAGHPSDEAAFLPPGQSIIVGSRDESTFASREASPQRSGSVLRGSWCAKQGPPLFSAGAEEWSACCWGDRAVGQGGPREASYCRQNTVKLSCLAQGRERGVERGGRGKGASLGGRRGFLQHWQGSTQSSVCAVLPRWRERISAPPPNTHRLPHASVQGGAAFFFKLSNNLSDGVSLLSSSVTHCV